jgi:hypothetical protein
LTRPEKFTRKLRLEKLMPRAAGAMEDHHGIGDVPLRVTRWRSERCVMNFEFWQTLAIRKGKVREDRVSFYRRCNFSLGWSMDCGQ